MKRKIWAVLMALVLVAGVVPTVAKAGDDHTCGFDTLVSVDDKQHEFKCDVCGELTGFRMNHSDSDGDGFCNCGYNLYPKHECTFDTMVSISDTQHQFKCTCGELVGVPMNHSDSDGDGKCNCGFEFEKAPEEEHEHNYVAHSNNDGTHTSSCNCGLETNNVKCLDNNGDGKCDSCEYVMYTAPEEEHEHNYVAHPNNDGTHNMSCNCGLEVKNLNCSDNDGDGKCDACGYQKYTAPEEEHEHNYVPHSNNDGTHTSSCNCGNEVTFDCSDNNGDGKCDACGYQKYTAPEEEHEHNYVAHPNNDGTHNMSCNCGLEVKDVTCLDNDGDGKCDSCGYEKYVAPTDKHEHNYIAHSNNDGTHLLTCNCGLDVKDVKCLDSDGDGKCDSCGYQKYVATCDHELHAVLDNKDGLTHNVVCHDCGKTLEVKVAHEYKDGVCACGAITEVEEPEDDQKPEVPGEDDKEEDKPVVTPGEDDKEEDKPAVTPEEDADDADDSKDAASSEDADLDDVPETGNGGVVTALISLVAVGLAGVFVFLQANRRKGM